jgi:hypothetical protein
VQFSTVVGKDVFFGIDFNDISNNFNIYIEVGFKWCNRAPVNFSDAYMLFAAKNKRNLPPAWYFVLQKEIVRHIS